MLLCVIILCSILLHSDLKSQPYFQQAVKYETHVELIPDLARLEGKQKLIYFNNSPDTLHELYFHLYLNKYRSGAYAKPFSTTTSAFIQIKSLQSVSGGALDYQIDNTIMKVALPDSPIAPGDSIALRFEFVSVLPRSRSRFGYSGDHFDVGNWYPAPAVYDRFGWHTDQHIDGEFYQEWGDYRVNITVPKDFVVAASGVLLNPDVLPDSVEFARRNIAYYNHQDRDASRVTYQFLAEKVHDFAWSADPEFVLVRRSALDTEINFFLTPYRLEEWKTIIDDCVKGFIFLNEQIGKYDYEQLTVVAGYVTAGGIEYPNIVFINDYITDKRQLAITAIHEMAHQWFYGILANNQTRYGWMDEGFTTFFEVECTEHLWGKEDNFLDRENHFWQKRFGYEINARHRTYRNYFDYALSGLEEPVNTRSDAFLHDSYTPYYDKTAVMLFTLKGMLGDSLFNAAVQCYFDQWKFRHPYPQDLFRSFEQTTGMELDWFWEQWLNRTWKCDFKLKALRTRWEEDFGSNYHSAYLHLQRAQPMLFPLELRVTLNNGEALDYRIPVEGWLPIAKEDSGTTNDLDSWHLANQDYLAHLKLPDRIRRIEIDPDQKLPDLNRFNNDNRFLPPVRFHWLRRQYLEPHWDAYTVTLYPSLFYNDVDGIKLGIRQRGNYLYPMYRTSGEALISAKSGMPSGQFTWQSPVSADLIDYDYQIHGYHLDGRAGGKVSVLKRNYESVHWEVGWQFQRLVESDYLTAPWSEGNISNIFLLLKKDAYHRGGIYTWDITAGITSSTFGSDFGFQQVELRWTGELALDYSKRIVAAVGSGWSFGDVPEQNYFYLGQASAAKQFDHPYARARGALPHELMDKGHFMVPGGGDIRGSLSTPVRVKQQGENLLWGRLKFYFPNPFWLVPARLPLLTDLEWHLFTHWAQVWDSRIREDQFGGEAGFSFSYDYIPIWLKYFHIARIHLDFPLWLHKPAPGYEEWDLRWNLRLDIERIFN